jgi:Zn finger protein HypA/HybF involved in hydrogenase expression
MENNKYKCLACRAVSLNSIKCPNCGSLEIIRKPIPAVDELNLDENNEDISHLAGLPLSEIYLHGVIAGKDKRIKQLKKELADNHASFVALVEGEIAEFQKVNNSSMAFYLTALLKNFKSK